jgi:hypothetical protein
MSVSQEISVNNLTLQKNKGMHLMIQKFSEDNAISTSNITINDILIEWASAPNTPFFYIY